MVLLNLSFYVLLLSVALARIPAAVADDGGATCTLLSDDVDNIGCEYVPAMF
jgi:hypothetical protein